MGNVGLNNSLIVAGVLIFAGVLALEAGITSAITEIVAGVLLVYFLPSVSKLDWLAFLANFGVLGLMFLALGSMLVHLERGLEVWLTDLLLVVFVLLTVPVSSQMLLRDPPRRRPPARPPSSPSSVRRRM